jgi:hypothetical protein
MARWQTQNTILEMARSNYSPVHNRVFARTILYPMKETGGDARQRKLLGFGEISKPYRRDMPFEKKTSVECPCGLYEYLRYVYLRET